MQKNKVFIFIFIFIAPFAKAQLKQGVSLDLIYPTVNNIQTPYVGRALGGVSFFRCGTAAELLGIAKQKENKLQAHEFDLELGYHLLGVRNKNIDYLYTDHLLEASFNWMFAPFPESSDFRLILGYRPSYLITTSSEKMENGDYVIDQDALSNHNRSGDWMHSINTGISLAMGSYTTLELKYVISLNENYTKDYVKGRFSTTEISLKWNLEALGNELLDKKNTIKNDAKQFKDGVLFVMLESVGEKEIQNKISSGKSDEVNELIKASRARNESVKKILGERYKLTPVYYFYDSNAYAITNHQYAGNIFDSNGQLLSNIPSKQKIYLAAVAEDFSDITHRIDLGFYIYDADFKQLGKPFNVKQNSVERSANLDIFEYFRKPSKDLSEERLIAVIESFQARIISLLSNH